MSTSPTPSREELVALRAQGMNRQEIADFYKVSVSRVKRWIKDLKVPSGGSSKRQKQAPVSARIDDGLTSLERARMILGKRMGEDFRGYTLDGRPIRIDALLRAAGILLPDVPC